MGQDMQQLTAMDASFLYFETPNTPMHIGSVAIYDPSTAPGGKVRFKDILKHIEERLHGARSFRQKIVRVPLDLDHPYWIEDPDFDLEFHVRHIALPQPGDWRQLCIQVARLHARGLDLTKPLWEYTVIEGLDNIEGLPPGCFAIASKVHHAAIDGVSGIDMTSAIHDLTPEADSPEQKDWAGESTPNPMELLLRTHMNNLQQPFRLLEVLSQTAPGLGKLRSALTSGEVRLPGNARPAPRTRFDKKVSSHRVVDGRNFSLADIKTMRQAVPGATINDAVLAIVGGALRAYLDAKNDRPSESLIAMAPISVRTEMEKGTYGNQVSAMMVPLGTHIADPLARLRFVHDEAVNSKALTNAVGARTLTQYSQFLPSALAGLGARLYTQLGIAERMAPAINTVVTNVPGPQQPLFMAGAKLLVSYGTGPIFDGMGIIHPVVSYCGDIAISFTSDRELMPDPAFYSQCLQDSFDALKSAAEAELKRIASRPPAPANEAKPAKKAKKPAA